MVKNEVARGHAIDWLKHFATSVRARDSTWAETLFDKGVFGFGTIARSYNTLAEYHELQWNRCWQRNEHFDFEYSAAQILQSEAGDIVILAVPWTSVGIHPDQTRFAREGRATIVLGVQGQQLKGLHCHFSKVPPDPADEF